MRSFICSSLFFVFISLNVLFFIHHFCPNSIVYLFFVTPKLLAHVCWIQFLFSVSWNGVETNRSIYRKQIEVSTYTFNDWRLSRCSSNKKKNRKKLKTVDCVMKSMKIKFRFSKKSIKFFLITLSNAKLLFSVC